MNNFLAGVLFGFLTFTNEGKQLSQKVYEYGIKFGKDTLKQMNEMQKGENKCTNTIDTGKQ